MNKLFEDLFSEVQTDMVSICLEYVENIADKIYIYCSYEDGVLSSDFFYCINGHITERHKINEYGSIQYDVSVERQDMVLDILIEDIKKLEKICEEYNQLMPTEIKLIYDVNSNSLKADYQYDLVYSNDDEKTADDIAEEWFEEVKFET